MESLFSDLYATRPTTMWLLEKLFTSAIVFFFLYMLRGCWRSARANQKLALADAYDYTRLGREQRSLLLPVNGSGGSGGRCNY